MESSIDQEEKRENSDSSDCVILDDSSDPAVAPQSSCTALSPPRQSLSRPDASQGVLLKSTAEYSQGKNSPRMVQQNLRLDRQRNVFTVFTPDRQKTPASLSKASSKVSKPEGEVLKKVTSFGTSSVNLQEALHRNPHLLKALQSVTASKDAASNVRSHIYRKAHSSQTEDRSSLTERDKQLIANLASLPLETVDLSWLSEENQLIFLDYALAEPIMKQPANFKRAFDDFLNEALSVKMLVNPSTLLLQVRDK